MPIMGRETVTEQEPEPTKSESANGKFMMRWIQELSQKSFSLSIKDGVRRTSDTKGKEKKEKYGWGRITTQTLFIDDEEEIQSGDFSYKQLQAATQDFSPANKIREDGFGSVYKGVLPDGRAITVKVTSLNSKQGKKEFLNEINAVSTLRHPNIVTMLGHCVAVDNRLLWVPAKWESR
ncbi:hypothetical protein MKW94_028924 [Papaver nudicaule]|uniref:Protein kinase domain-containing protein n=1 Tax=Papaver nudicaule TaxID=74823 RepID=A0AA41VS71_PAPNU|nr:hypothetical protein [Papaver nudicaule]